MLFRLSNILRQYQSRNVSTKLEPVTASWTPGNASITGAFRLDVRINYAADTFDYWTGFWELMKWAWIQYLSVLLVFIFVMGRIREYVFRNRLVTTVPVPDQQLLGAMANRGAG